MRTRRTRPAAVLRLERLDDRCVWSVSPTAAVDSPVSTDTAIIPADGGSLLPSDPHAVTVTPLFGTWYRSAEPIVFQYTYAVGDTSVTMYRNADGSLTVYDTAVDHWNISQVQSEQPSASDSGPGRASADWLSLPPPVAGVSPAVIGATVAVRDGGYGPTTSPSETRRENRLAEAGRGGDTSSLGRRAPVASPADKPVGVFEEVGRPSGNGGETQTAPGRSVSVSRPRESFVSWAPWPAPPAESAVVSDAAEDRGGPPRPAFHPGDQSQYEAGDLRAADDGPGPDSPVPELEDDSSGWDPAAQWAVWVAGAGLAARQLHGAVRPRVVRPESPREAE